MPVVALSISNCFHNVEPSRKRCSSARMLLIHRNYIYSLYTRSYLLIQLYLPIHNPFMFPATLSTAFFNRWDSSTTRSLSSSAHSAMNVVVSATKPASKMSSDMYRMMCSTYQGASLRVYATGSQSTSTRRYVIGHYRNAYA